MKSIIYSLSLLLFSSTCLSLRNDLANLPGLSSSSSSSSSHHLVESSTSPSVHSFVRSTRSRPFLSARTRDTLSTTFRSLFSSVDRCILGTHGWYHHSLGHFDQTHEYCDSSCLRGIICCAPETPEQLRVNFQLSTPFNSYPMQIAVGDYHARNLIRESGRPVVIIVHGFLNHHAYDGVWNETRDAHLSRGSNVIVVDWNRGNRIYLQSVPNVRVVGAMIGQLLEYLGVSEKSDCVGFSLGAHICGEAGSWLKRHGLVLEKCTGIDPAGPGYDGCSDTVRLDKDDCHVVRVIHTSQFLGHKDGFGTRFKSGHCDYWINDGLKQPGCEHERSLISIRIGRRDDQLFESDSMAVNGISCDHNRAMKVYLSQVRRECDFRGDESEECGIGRICVPLTPPVRYSLPPDDSCTPYNDLDLLVETSASPPYC